jgi:phage gp36-like protein
VPYCSVQDVIDRLSASGVIYLADDNGDGSISNAEMLVAVQSSIDAASSEIDAALIDRISLPIAEPNEWFRHRGIDLAAERLAERKGQGVPTSLVEAARRSRDWLEEIRTGERAIPGVSPLPSAVGPTSTVAGWPRVANPRREDSH